MWCPAPPDRPARRALKILLSEADGQPYDLERNEIIALFNTLNKLSSSLETIDYMSNLLQDPLQADPKRLHADV